MTEPTRYSIRAIWIVATVAVMAVAVWVVGDRITGRDDHAPHKSEVHGPVDLMAMVKMESAGVYRDVTMSTPMDPAVRQDLLVRDMTTYYERRAYAGAPPYVPHAVDSERQRTQDCNTCHEKGGYVAPYNAYSPVTPHPEYENCLQCHAQVVGEGEFRPHDWVSVQSPALHRPALPGGPPPMPHSLQLRESCLSCHAGPAAPLEIRTSHPERLNCVQCHVLQNESGLFARSLPAEGDSAP